MPNSGMPSRPGVGRCLGCKGTGKGLRKACRGIYRASGCGSASGIVHKFVVGISISRPPLIPKRTVIGDPGSVVKGNIGVVSTINMPRDPVVGFIEVMYSYISVITGASPQGMYTLPPLPDIAGGVVTRPFVAVKSVPDVKLLRGNKASESVRMEEIPERDLENVW